MTEKPYVIRWAEKLKPIKLKRLYENDANGLTDEALIDDVGWTLYLRCESILLVCNGSVKCPQCSTNFLCVRYKEKLPHEAFPCPHCGWTTSEMEYTQSHHGHELSGRGAMPAFQEFVNAYPKAHSPQKRILLIDCLIHAFHHDVKRSDHPHRVAAVNLIEGSSQQAIALLDNLAYGSGNGPEMRQTHTQWQEQVQRMRNRREQS